MTKTNHQNQIVNKAKKATGAALVALLSCGALAQFSGLEAGASSLVVGSLRPDAAQWNSAWSPSVGQPINDVHNWGPGCIQDFRGGSSGPAALMQKGCQGPVFAVTGAQWAKLSVIGSPIVGYPIESARRVSNMTTQRFDAGTNGLDAIVRIDGAVAAAVVRSRAVDLSDTMFPGRDITVGQSLSAASGGNLIRVQSDGDIVEYAGNGNATWATGTVGMAKARLSMQVDGNLVAYDGDGKAEWATSTQGAGATATILSDGNFVVYDQDGRPMWDRMNRPPGMMAWKADTVQSGATLTADFTRISTNGAYRLAMQGDGNLVIYQGGSAIWSSQTPGNSGSIARMQPDGNLVVISPSGRALFYTRTDQNVGARAILTNDGALIIVSTGGQTLWSSKGTSAPSAKADAAARWAEARQSKDVPGVDENNNDSSRWSGWCETFAEQAWRAGAGVPMPYYLTADDHRITVAGAGKISWGVPPRGAVVFYTPNHVAISVGGGKVVSTQGFTYNFLPNQLVDYNDVAGVTYAGWYLPA